MPGFANRHRRADEVSWARDPHSVNWLSGNRFPARATQPRARDRTEARPDNWMRRLFHRFSRR